MAMTPSHTGEPVLERAMAPELNRIESLDAYWAYYLSEHRKPGSRALHFLGTTLFFASVGASVVAHPVVFPAAMAVVVALAWWASQVVERSRPAFGALFVMVVVAAAASPWYILSGVVAAYLCAWIGHFRIEHNRPATFQYPVWSLLSDFRMWGEMVRGRLWTGDPVDQLD